MRQQARAGECETLDDVLAFAASKHIDLISRRVGEPFPDPFSFDHQRTGDTVENVNATVAVQMKPLLIPRLLIH